MSVVLLEKKNRIGTVTLNRPEAANAINRELARALKEALFSLDRDKGIWVIILTGAGQKVFCSGLDLKERAAMTEEQIDYSRKVELFPLYFSMEDIETPMIAAVNGAAIGGGAELAMACDIRVASDNASFGLGEVKWGIIPAAGGIQRLPLIAGMGIAKELILTGRTIDAKKAWEFKIYNDVVPPSQLMGRALAMAEELLQNSPVALRQARKAFRFEEAIHNGLSHDIELSNGCYSSEDRKEGVRAFSEKRKPNWKNA
jgi:enoyl-CoA hydratase/carnithine racemase